jgi:flavin reductase (DIM6/NTAB) family NADH-FMN oxidoreductase RutF
MPCLVRHANHQEHDTGEFVTHLATLPQVLPLHISAREFEPDEDEFDTIGLNKLPSLAVKPPRIEGAPIAFECVVDRIFSAPDGLNNMVFGRVVQFYIRDDLYLPNGRIDTGAVAPVGRLAAEYTVVDNAGRIVAAMPVSRGCHEADAGTG